MVPNCPESHISVKKYFQPKCIKFCVVYDTGPALIKKECISEHIN